MHPPVEVLAPTRLEYWALRALRPPAIVSSAGVGLTGWSGPAGSRIVVCGLAGSLDPSIDSGTVLVPDLVRCVHGSVVRCDPALHRALVRGARAIGFNPETGPLLTAPFLVSGPARAEWTARGFVAADMETGLLAARDVRFATVRVVLDSPKRSISDRWLAPARAVREPALWPELLWLGWTAPRYALRSARVLKAALEQLQRPGSR